MALHYFVYLSSIFCSSFESPVIGTRDSVNSITRDSILKYLENQYAKDSMLISVVGNVDEKRVMNFFNGKFEKFAAKKKGLTGLEEVQPGNVAHLIKRKDIEQAHLFLGIRTPEIDNELQLPLRVITNLFGDLSDYNPLCAIIYKGALFRHLWKITHEQ